MANSSIPLISVAQRFNEFASHQHLESHAHTHTQLSSGVCVWCVVGILRSSCENSVGLCVVCVCVREREREREREIYIICAVQPTSQEHVPLQLLKEDQLSVYVHF